MKKILTIVLSLSLATAICACSYTPNIMDVSVPVGEFEIEKGVPIPLPYSCVLEDQQEGFSPPMFYKVVDSGVRMEFGSADSDIALVDGAGKVVGVAPGETSITVKAVNAVSEKSTSLKVRCFEYQNDLDAVPERLDVKAGEAMDLAKLYEEYIRWNALIETSDENIATVDGTVLTAGKPGDATVSLTLGGETRNIAFRSIKMATEYTLNHDTLEGEAGTTARLGVGDFKPETANGGLDLTFTSSDEDVVTADEDGTVHFIAPGEATITSVNELGMETECKVTVTPATFKASFFASEGNGNWDVVNEKGEKTGSLDTKAPSATGTTNPGDYDRSVPAVDAVLSMVGQSRKCTEIAEAAANTRGATGWEDHGSYNILSPENFLKLGTKVSYAQVQPGDILYYANGGWGFSHVAVYIGKGMAVHGNFDTAGTTKIASATYTTLTSVIHIG